MQHVQDFAQDSRQLLQTLKTLVFLNMLQLCYRIVLCDLLGSSKCCQKCRLFPVLDTLTLQALSLLSSHQNLCDLIQCLSEARKHGAILGHIRQYGIIIWPYLASYLALCLADLSSIFSTISSSAKLNSVLNCKRSGLVMFFLAKKKAQNEKSFHDKK